MSSSTALLPKKKDDHPIFLRICHSPWVSIGQKALVGLRGLLAIYLFVSFSMIIDYEINRYHRGWEALFALSNISYLIQVLYAWLAFIWTFMHLHYPHHGSQSPSAATKLQKLFSPPRQKPSAKNREFFSIFYTAAVVYPHVVTFIHWVIVDRRGKNTVPGSEVFGHGWFTEFFFFNKFAVNSIIALIEVFFLSSIRRQVPIWAHFVGLAVLSLIYIGWAYIGHLLVGPYTYYFLDPKEIGWEYVIVAIVAFVALVEIFFFIIYGITGFREMVTRKGEHKSYGYNQLPQ